MFIPAFYNRILKPVFLIQNNRYNVFSSKNLTNLLIIIQLNSFANDRNLKLVKLFFLLFFLTAQKPFMKKVKFCYIKKQILKKFFFIVNLRKNKFYNFFFYFAKYYLFYFNIYYLKPIKYNTNRSSFVYYVDNVQTHFKSYGKLNIQSQIKISYPNELLYNQFIKLLNNYNLLNIRKII